MKIAELISILSAFPADLEVTISIHNQRYAIYQPVGFMASANNVDIHCAKPSEIARSQEGNDNG